MDFEYVPWSMTPFKPLWHRRVPVGGSRYSVNHQKHSQKNIDSEKLLLSTHYADFKAVFGVGEGGEVTKMGLNGGMGENPFAPNYFNMQGSFETLQDIELNFKKLKEGNHVLELKPAKLTATKNEDL